VTGVPFAALRRSRSKRRALPLLPGDRRRWLCGRRLRFLQALERAERKCVHLEARRIL